MPQAPADMLQAGEKLVRITDCQSVKLRPQRMAGEASVPQAELVRVGKHDSDGWSVKQD